MPRFVACLFYWRSYWVQCWLICLVLAIFSKVGNGAWVQFEFLCFRHANFELSAIISMLIVTLVIMTETTADIIAVGEIVGTKVDSERISNGLRADMFPAQLHRFLFIHAKCFCTERRAGSHYRD